MENGKHGQQAPALSIAIANQPSMQRNQQPPKYYYKISNVIGPKYTNTIDGTHHAGHGRHHDYGMHAAAISNSQQARTKKKNKINKVHSDSHLQPRLFGVKREAVICGACGRLPRCAQRPGHQRRGGWEAGHVSWPRSSKILQSSECSTFVVTLLPGPVGSGRLCLLHWFEASFVLINVKEYLKKTLHYLFRCATAGRRPRRGAVASRRLVADIHSTVKTRTACSSCWCTDAYLCITYWAPAGAEHRIGMYSTCRNVNEIIYSLKR